MACPELNPGAGPPLIFAAGKPLKRGIRSGPFVNRAVVTASSGTISPERPRTKIPRRSSGLLRNSGSACITTCHTRPYLLYWLTYSDPNSDCSAPYTSAIGAPIVSAFSRSTFTLSCREAGLNVELTPASVGCCFAAAVTCCTACARRAGSPPVRSCTHISKPPWVPSPGIGGGLIGMTTASWIAASLGATAAIIASTESSLPSRSAKSLRLTKTVAAFVLYWPSSRLYPDRTEANFAAGCCSTTSGDLLPDRIGTVEARRVRQDGRDVHEALVLRSARSCPART